MTPSSTPSVPLGSVVERELGVGWLVRSDPYGIGLGSLAGLAIRRNPRRAQLIVSTVLAKHIAAPPATVRASGLLLAGLVQQALVDRAPGGGLPAELSAGLLGDSASVDRLAVGLLPGAPAVLGFCETATALGHIVADAFTDATYVHTTRRPDPARPTLLGFDEEHSHAVAHHLQAPAAFLDHDRPVVLVDDEISTGTTALNTIAELHALQPRDSYVLAALLDLRPDPVREAFRTRADELGVRVQVVSLIDGALTLPDDVLQRAAVLQAELEAAAPARSGWAGMVPDQRRDWPADVPTGGRHGFSAADREPFSDAIAALAAGLSLGPGPTLVLGTEELMYAPVRLAHALELLSGREVLVQSTTRSPVLPYDRAGYAIRRRLAFPSPEDGGRSSYLYNVVPPRWAPDQIYCDIVVVAEEVSVGIGALLMALRPWATDGVRLVVLPS